MITIINTRSINHDINAMISPRNVSSIRVVGDVSDFAINDEFLVFGHHIAFIAPMHGIILYTSY